MKELFDSIAPQNAENSTVANSLPLFLKYSVKCLFFKRLYQTIENLKYETPETEKIIGVEYYQAVIRDGVRDYSGFKEWRKQHPVTGVVEWMP